jgi:hypothetical protein
MSNSQVFLTIMDYLKYHYPKASRYELSQMEREIIQEQEEAYRFESDDDFFNCVD